MLGFSVNTSRKFSTGDCRSFLGLRSFGKSGRLCRSQWPQYSSDAETWPLLRIVISSGTPSLTRVPLGFCPKQSGNEKSITPDKITEILNARRSMVLRYHNERFGHGQYPMLDNVYLKDPSAKIIPDTTQNGRKCLPADVSNVSLWRGGPPLRFWQRWGTRKPAICEVSVRL